MKTKNKIVNNNGVSHKSAVTIKNYTVKAFGHCFTVPAGSKVTNETAIGNDDNSRFLHLADCRKVAWEETKLQTSLLLHDLTHYGLNIPAEYCEPYAK